MGEYLRNNNRHVRLVVYNAISSSGAWETTATNYMCIIYYVVYTFKQSGGGGGGEEGKAPGPREDGVCTGVSAKNVIKPRGVFGK